MLFFHLGLCDQTQFSAIIDVPSSQVGSECGHVMSVQARDGSWRRFNQSRAWICALSELDNVHLTKAVASHSVVYFLRHSPKIFANQNSFVPMRFEAENCVKFFGWIRNISAFFR